MQMNLIRDINKSIHQKVSNKNHPFLMTGQSIVEWVKCSLLSEKYELNTYNFVPAMKSMQFLERKMNTEKQALADEQKLSNVMTFGMMAISIFEKSIFENSSPSNEKKLPMYNYYIGNMLEEEVAEHIKPNTISIVVDVTSISSDHDDLDNWKQPTFIEKEDKKIISCDSSHYLYLGYLYLVALAWEKDFNVGLLGNLPLETCINLIFDFIKNNYSDVLVKPT